MLTHRAYITLLFLCIATGVIYCTVPEGYSLLYNKTLVVPANIEWVGTGLNLTHSDYIIISAGGWWGYDPRPQFLKGPDGVAKGSGLQQGRLSAKIGGGPEFAIGSYYEGMSTGKGALMLHMHDTTQRHDNVGNVSANVLVYSQKVDESPAADTPQENQAPEASNDKNPSGNTAKQAENGLCTVAIVLLIGILTFYAHQKRQEKPNTEK